MAEKTASLTVLGGPLAGARCPLPESGAVTVGSAEGSTLRLDLPTVSAYHARIEVHAGRVVVHDTGADRALHVNDNPLEPGGTVLRNGDILWLGAPGEEDVVMLQCVLPRRPVEAPSPAPTSGPAAPTPEVETQALWSFAEAPASPPAPRVAAEPVREEPTGREETMAILPEGLAGPAAEPDTAAAGAAPEEDLVFDEASLAGTSEREVDLAAEIGEEVVFAEESAPVVEASEVEASPSPTILMASAEEIAEPQVVSIDFGEGVVEPQAIAMPEIVASTEPVVPSGPAVEPAPQPLPAFAPVPTPVAPSAVPHPAPPPLPSAHAPSPPTTAKPLGSVPPLPAGRPAAPARPPSPHPASSAARPPARPPLARHEARPVAQKPAPRSATHVAPHATPHRATRLSPPAEATGPEVIEAEPPTPGGRRTMLLAVAGAAGVLVIAGLAWMAWRLLAGGPSTPRPRPTPVVRATPPPAPVVRPTPAPVAIEPTPEAPPLAASPIEMPTPTPTPRATPAPTRTPTPRATPTPAAARPTPTPTGPSAQAILAQQKAFEAQALLTRAESALGVRQYDAAVTNLDDVLRLDPANARATALRADAVRRRDMARRRFTPGRTVVQTQKAQKGGGLAGFDTGDADLRSSDFLGRVEFEMTPASGVEPGDAWTLKVYIVNEGKKPIRVNGLVVGTTVNGTGGGGPLASRVREIAPQQRSLVAETSGTWPEGTTSWTTEVTVTGGKGESLRNTIAWR